MQIELSGEVSDYIRALSSVTEKAQIAQYLDRQEELGYRLKIPVSKAIREGINEIRPGPHRLFFFYYQSRIMVIHAFRKKTQETPEREIKTAMHKRQMWRQNHEKME